MTYYTQELETIIRDDAFRKKSFFIKKSFQHHEFAKYIMSKYNIKNIGGTLYVYNNEEYKIVDLDALMIKEIPNLTIHNRKEAESFIYHMSPKVEESDKRYIKLKNGVFDLEKFELLPNHHEFIITNIIPWNYNPTAYNAVMDKTLSEWANDDPDKRNLYLEMMGYCLYRSCIYKKYFIIQGPPDCGKSTFTEIIQTLVGKENTSSLDLDQLTSERYFVTDLISKLANLGDDISGRTISNGEKLKTLSAGHTLKVRGIFERQVDLTNYATLIFNCNDAPKIPDLGGGHDKRHLLIPFRSSFTQIDYQLKDKLLTRDGMEYLLTLALEGLRRLTNSNRFTIPKDVELMTEEYKRENNPIIEFIDEVGVKDGDIVKDTYLSYYTWCLENGYKAANNSTFGKEVKRNLGLVSKTVRVGKDVFRTYVKP